jgi:DNA-binding MarR family transcriptional regulator
MTRKAPLSPVRNTRLRRGSIARAEGSSFLDGFTLYWLSVVSSQSDRQLTAMLHDALQISLAEWRVMLMVGKMPGLSTDAIAGKTTMDKAKVSRAIARQTALGYVMRSTLKSDRRLNSVTITNSGKRVFKQCLDVAENAQADFLRSLSATEHGALFELLTRLNKSNARGNG